MSEIKIKLAAGTDVGLVRKNNEDNFVVNRDLSQSEWIIPQSSETIPLGKYGTLLVVADGMGGTNAGEVASAIAIETVQNAFTPEKLDKIVKWPIPSSRRSWARAAMPAPPPSPDSTP